MFAQVGLTGEFLKLKETRALFRKEQHFPSDVIDRGMASGDLLARARAKVGELVDGYRRPVISPHVEEQLLAIARREAGECLPGIEVGAVRG